MPMGTIDWCKVRLMEPIARKNIDIVTSTVKQNRRYVKNAPASRRRLVMKYRTTLKRTLVATLAGKSQTIADIASANGCKKT